MIATADCLSITAARQVADAALAAARSSATADYRHLVATLARGDSADPEPIRLAAAAAGRSLDDLAKDVETVRKRLEAAERIAAAGPWQDTCQAAQRAVDDARAAYEKQEAKAKATLSKAREPLQAAEQALRSIRSQRPDTTAAGELSRTASPALLERLDHLAKREGEAHRKIDMLRGFRPFLSGDSGQRDERFFTEHMRQARHVEPTFEALRAFARRQIEGSGLPGWIPPVFARKFLDLLTAEAEAQAAELELVAIAGERAELESIIRDPIKGFFGDEQAL